MKLRIQITENYLLYYTFILYVTTVLLYTCKSYLYAIIFSVSYNLHCTSGEEGRI